jgi:hypothetical protein
LIAIRANEWDEQEKLEAALRTRAYKLMQSFEWTPENMERLLYLNQKLMDCFKKLKDEAKQVLDTVQKRIDEKDAFLHDFGIEARITPYFYERGDDTKFYEVEN